MSLEKLVSSVEKQAEKDSAGIVRNAKKGAKEIINRAKKEIKEQDAAFDAETEKLVSERKRMLLSGIQLKQAHALMNEKKKIIDSVYSRLEEKLGKMPLEDRKKMLGKLVKKAIKELPTAKFVYSNEKDKAIAAKLNGLVFGGTIESIGGLIIENSSRNIRVNCTFDVLIQNLRQETVHVIAEKIF